MKGQKLSEMSSEALLEQEKSVKVLTSMLAGALLVLVVTAVILSYKQGFTPLLIVPFALLPIVLLNLSNSRQIRKELDSRNEVL